MPGAVQCAQYSARYGLSASRSPEDNCWTFIKNTFLADISGSPAPSHFRGMQGCYARSTPAAALGMVGCPKTGHSGLPIKRGDTASHTTPGRTLCSSYSSPSPFLQWFFVPQPTRLFTYPTITAFAKSLACLGFPGDLLRKVRLAAELAVPSQTPSTVFLDRGRSTQ